MTPGKIHQYSETLSETQDDVAMGEIHHYHYEEIRDKIRDELFEDLKGEDMNTLKLMGSEMSFVKMILSSGKKKHRKLLKKLSKETFDHEEFELRKEEKRENVWKRHRRQARKAAMAA